MYVFYCFAVRKPGNIKSVRPDIPEVTGQFWIPIEDLDMGDTLGKGHYGSVVKGQWREKGQGRERSVAIKTMKGNVLKSLTK